MTTTHKITPAQLRMLKAMRDGAWLIKYSVTSTGIRLYTKDSINGQPIRWEWWLGLRPFFIETKDKNYNYTHRYDLRPDAELTAEWLAAEIARQQRAEQDKKAAQETEHAQRIAADSAWFNEGTNGPYRIEWDGAGGTILRGNHIIASLGSRCWSGRDALDDLLKRDGNAEHFDAIKQMVRAANAGAKQ